MPFGHIRATTANAIYCINVLLINYCSNVSLINYSSNVSRYTNVFQLRQNLNTRVVATNASIIFKIIIAKANKCLQHETAFVIFNRSTVFAGNRNHPNRGLLMAEVSLVPGRGVPKCSKTCT